MLLLQRSIPRRRFSILRPGIIVLALLTVTAACGGPTLGTRPETVNPQDLFSLLANTPFLDSELPPRFSSARLASSKASSQEENYGETEPVSYEVVYEVSDIEGSINELIGYIVFETVADADSEFEDFRVELLKEDSSVQTDGRSTQIADECPVQVPIDESFLFDESQSAKFTSACVIRVGNVVLVAGSLERDTADQATTNARDLAQASITHLQKVVRQAAAAAAR